MSAIDNCRVIALPFAPDAVWGPRGSHLVVTGAIAGVPFRGPLDKVDDRLVVVLDHLWDGPVVDAGAEVDVVIAAEDPQSDNVAPDVAAAWAAAPEARSFFDGLAGYYRRNYIRWIEGAKLPTTRAARIAQMVTLLKHGQREK